MLRKLSVFALIGCFISNAPALASQMRGSFGQRCASIPAQYLFTGDAPQVVMMKAGNSGAHCTQAAGAVPRALIGVCGAKLCRFDARAKDGSLINDGTWSISGQNDKQAASSSPMFDRSSILAKSIRFRAPGGQWQFHFRNQAGDDRLSANSAWFAGVCDGLLCSFHAAPHLTGPYSWDFGDGAFETSDAPVVAHRYQHAAKLTVSMSDALGGRAVANAKFANAEPRADFKVECVEGLCTYDGQISRDADGEIAQWTWSFADGTQLQGPVVMRAQDDTERVALKVTDDQGATVTVEKSVAPGTKQAFGKPAGFSGAWFNPSLDGSGINLLRRDDNPETSADERALVVYYYGYLNDGTGLLWLISNPLFGAQSELSPGTSVTMNMLKGENGSLNSPSPLSTDNPWGKLTLKFDSCSSGSLELHSNATDGDIDSTAIQKLVGIGGLDDCGEAGAPPVVALSVECPNLACAFTADSSVSTGREIKFYNWLFGDGAVLSGDKTLNTTSHTYPSDTQDYKATVIVTDSAGDATRVTKVLENLVNAAPIPDFDNVIDCEKRLSGKIRCNLDASASTDPDGDDAALIFRWDFGDGSATGGAAKNVRVPHDYAKPDKFPVTLTVKDALGASGSVTKDVDANESPIASFTVDCQNTGDPLKCRFDPAASSDDGSITRYSWDFGDGSAIVAGASSTAVSHTFPGPGQYAVVLTVTDNSGKTGSSEQMVAIAVGNPPVAAFNVDCDDATLACTFVSTPSDPDSGDSISKYLWDFGDDPGQTGLIEGSKTMPHTYAAGGSVTVRHQVFDAVGNPSQIFSLVFDPADTNEAPMADVGFPSCTLLACSFESFSSTDPDGDNSKLGYQWDFGDGNTGNQKSLQHTYAAAGTYTVSLTVTDEKGKPSAPAQTTVTVAATAPNVAPVAGFSHSCTNFTCSFNSTILTSDGDGTITQRVWNFGDNSPTQTGVQLLHIFQQSGTFQVTLTVTDDDGATGSSTVSVTVPDTGGGGGSPPPGGNQPPTQGSIDDACTGLTCTFTVFGVSDPDGQIVGRAWNFGDGSPIITNSGGTAVHTYAAASTYTVVFTATDNLGAKSLTSKSINLAQSGIPIAIITQPQPCVIRTCSFDASSSVVQNGGIAGATFSWNFGDQTLFGTQVNVNHTYVSDATYTVTLTVTDNLNQVGSTSKSVTITSQTLANLAAADVSCQNLNCNFDGTRSVAPDGDMDNYSWDFGDQTPLVAGKTQSQPNHVYAAAGTYTVALTVTDASGNPTTQDTASVSITVNDPPPLPNEANTPAYCSQAPFAPPSGTQRQMGSTIDFRGTVLKNTEYPWFTTSGAVFFNKNFGYIIEKNSYMAGSFVSHTDGAVVGGIAHTDWPQPPSGPGISARLVAISRCPGDFSGAVTPDGDGDPDHCVTAQHLGSGGVLWDLTTSPFDPNRTPLSCHLKPNTLYFINVIHAAKSSPVDGSVGTYNLCPKSSCAVNLTTTSG